MTRKKKPVTPKLAPDKAPPSNTDLTSKIELLDVERLKTHPRNYRLHPDDQLSHLERSIRENGFYRNIVIARDDTILAGHGIVKAATKMGIKKIPVIRLDVDPNDEQALRLLVGDNESIKLAVVDDRALTEMLKEIKEMSIDGLVGTGFDEQMLAALALITRPASELKNHNDAAHWVGMPECELGETPIKLVVNFKTENDREKFAKQIKIKIDMKGKSVWSTRWPWTDRESRADVRFESNRSKAK